MVGKMLRLFEAGTLTPYKVAQMKTHQEFECTAQALEAQYREEKKLLQHQQRQEMQALKDRQRVKLTKVKNSLPLPRRLLVMKETVDSLRKQRAHKAATCLDTRRQHLEEKYWKGCLGGPKGLLNGLAREERSLEDRQNMALTQLDIELEKHRVGHDARRVLELQRVRHTASRRGDSPFSVWFFASKGQVGSLRNLLAKHPSKANFQDPDTGCTPLAHAARQGKYEAAKLLLEEYGADVDIRDGRDNTALHHAAGWGDYPTTTLILEHGGDPRAVNADGHTPADLAKSNKRTRIIRLFENWEPMGVSLEERTKIFCPDPDPFKEPVPSICQQLRLLEVKQSTMGDCHPCLIATLKKLVQLYRKEGRDAEAHKIVLRLISVATACLPSDPILGWAYNELGSILHDRGEQEDVEDAADSFRKAVTVLERCLGESSIDLIEPLNNLALHYLSCSMVYEAEPVLRRQLALQEKYGTTEMGSMVEVLIPTLDLLGYTLLLKKDFEGARQMYHRSYRIAQQFYTDEDHDMAPRLENIGMCYFCQGDSSQAEVWFEKAYKAHVKNGEDLRDFHPLRIISNIAVTICKSSSMKF